MNRQLSYEVVNTATSTVLLRVKYEHALDGAAAGNVTQIRRMTPRDPQFVVADVAATCFAYNKIGELWIATQRTWVENNGQPDMATLAIKDIVAGGI